MGCLPSKIIGLSLNDCPCYDPGKPGTETESDSELYLDELVRLSDLQNLEDCSNGSIWDLMSKSIAEGIEFTEEDIVSCLKERSYLEKKACSRIVGTKNATQPTAQSKTYAGLKITFWNIKGAEAVLRSVNTLFAGTGVLNGQIIFKYLDADPIPFTLNTTANQTVINEVGPILIQQFSEYCEYVEAYVIYEVDPGNQPLNNDLDCGCTKSVKCEDDYAKIEAIAGDDLNDIENWRGERYAQGLMLDLSFRCRQENTICDGSLDYTTGIGRNLARAVQHKSAFLLWEKIYYSHKPSLWTVVGKEDLETMLPRLEEKYKEYVGKVCQEIDLDNTGCFSCKENLGIRHNRIG